MRETVEPDVGNFAAEQAYAEDIKTTWAPIHKNRAAAVEAILATGRRLGEIKTDLGHGRFLRVFQHGAACREVPNLALPGMERGTASEFSMKLGALLAGLNVTALAAGANIKSPSAA
jgi:hypothetical protein